MIGYKLFHIRKDGSLGPLFINRRQRIEPGVVYPYEDHPTKGYAHRPGWHICSEPIAPHLKTNTPDRVWRKVEFELLDLIERPASQGGIWYLGSTMMVLSI
jgi:hypothetical protein